MSWSPNPLDYENLHHFYKGASQKKNVLALKLPSQTLQHGGESLANRSKNKKRFENSVKVSEKISSVPLPAIESAKYDKTVLTPSFGFKESYVVADVEDNEVLDDFTYKDIDALKELNCSMAKKKEIRARLIADQGNTVGKSKWSSDTFVQWRRFRENIRDAFNQMKPWESSLHEIEGRFGTGIRSYFAFLRWLFALNIYTFFLIFFFVVLPTIIFDSLRTSGSLSVIPSASKVSDDCSYNPYNPNSINTFPQYIIWWFTGQGFMEKTLLFIGYYDNASIQSSNWSFFYNLPLAYLLVAFFYFLLSLILVVRKAAYGLRESLSTDERFHQYCNRVFNGWDYCINDEKAASLKHQNIKHELEVDLEEDKIRERQANRTRNEKAQLYTKRVFINFIVACTLVACLIAIFFAAQYALQNGQTYDDNFVLDLLITYLTSIVITFANFMAPILFGFLVKFEDYSPEFTIRFTLVRTVVLRLSSIVFLYVVVYLQINCNQYSNIVSTQYNQQCNHCIGVECWETYIGQEMYKLTLLDFFIVIGITLFVEFPRKLIITHCNLCGLSKMFGYQEYDVPKNVLDLVYTQAIAWIGSFYAPVLPVVVVVKLFVFFYLKKLTLINNCRPAARPYRASRSGTFFYLILLFGFAVAVFPVAIGISVVTPSTDCGPFRNYPSMFYAITLSILNLSTWAQEMFWFFGSSGFAAVIILILGLILYYFYASNSAQKITIRLLKNQLTLEGKDKQFLLQRVNQLNENAQEYQKNLDPKSYDDFVMYNQVSSSKHNFPGQLDDELPNT